MLVSQVLSPTVSQHFPSSSGMVLGKIVQITYGQARLESLPQAVGLLERLEVGVAGGNCLVMEWTPTFLVDSCKQVHLHPRKLTWNLKMMVFHRNLLF